MKKLLVVLVCLGVSLNMPVGLEAAKDWEKIDLTAVCLDGEIRIVKDYHDAAVVGTGDKIEWKMQCVNCGEVSNKKVLCGGTDATQHTVKYWIHSVEFSADLEDAAENITSGVASVKVKKVRKGKKNKLMNPGEFTGEDPNSPGTKKVDVGKSLKSKKLDWTDPDEFPNDLHELWKFTVVAATAASGIDETNFEGLKSVCDALPGCDYWDPHIYVHGDGKPGI